jgi:putative transposase
MTDRTQSAEEETSDIENPRFARMAAKALARSQRNTARKKKGSKHWARAKQRQARLAATVANQRADFHHKAARDLIAAYDRIGIEDLKVKNMSRRGRGNSKTGLNRSIADASWGQFRHILTWQATKPGSTEIPPLTSPTEV